MEVPWSSIAEITHVIKLDRDADELGLGTGDTRAARWVQKVPGS